MRTVDYTGYQGLAITREGTVLTVALDRPEALNAIDDEMHEELGRVFADVALDDRTRVVVLTGTGRAFSAGGDIKSMLAHAERTGSFGHSIDMATAKRIVFSLLDLEKPVLAKVNGPAMGLGATLALLCDMVYMAESAVLADPHVRAGVVAGDGGAVIWPQLIGYARAKELLMTGDPVDAARAAELGLVNHVTPDSELDEVVAAMARRLAAGPQEAIRWTKVAANLPLKRTMHSVLDASLAYELLTMRSAGHERAVRAFVDGREPQFD
ncbi:enoyl-CoA hydratase/isomerase family protein [Pseudonocardia pini]|uniref:enoyl-CoA hydratase/isomerase family protein n=1 Tax=Pseudonocardia pini TaxID=2758030 RepID=UPI0015EFE383|nr:enoyl-CoA hydratase-related protein [Pseudonocardia pini]